MYTHKLTRVLLQLLTRAPMLGPHAPTIAVCALLSSFSFKPETMSPSRFKTLASLCHGQRIGGHSRGKKVHCICCCCFFVPCQVLLKH